MAASPSPLSLADLEPGADARVESVEAGTPIGRRLQDLGFVPGTPVRVLRRAPLGDPVEYELRGTRLCLRRSEARRIHVQRAAPGEAPR
jgi:Fe2+ transport system protein FeoA